MPEGGTNRKGNGAEEKNTFINMSVFPNGHLSKLNEYIYLYISLLKWETLGAKRKEPVALLLWRPVTEGE